MQAQNEENEDRARQLEATGNYRVLRRLIPRQPTPTPADRDRKVAIIVDFETTGLDPVKDEIIEVAMVKFRYSNSDQVAGVTGIFQSFNQPAAVIPSEIIQLTGITEEMVTGQKIDAVALDSFVADANIVIAHNAAFDRKFAERCWPVFEHKHWACSATGIEWQKYGFGGVKLPYLLTQSGFFHDAHRALDDCHATFEILARDFRARRQRLWRSCSIAPAARRFASGPKMPRSNSRTH